MVDVGGQGGAAHRAICSVGMAPQGDRTSCSFGDRVDHGGDVREVPLDGVAEGVATGAEASAIHRERREVVAEHGDERFEGGVVGDRAVDHHERRSVALHPNGDRGPVGRADVEPADHLVSGHRRSAVS